MKDCLKNTFNHCFVFQHFLYVLIVSFLLSVTFLIVTSPSVSLADTNSVTTVKVQDNSQANLVDGKIQLFDDVKSDFITLAGDKKQNNNDKKLPEVGKANHGHGHGHGHGDDDDDDDDHHTTTTTICTTTTTCRSTTTTTHRPCS